MIRELLTAPTVIIYVAAVVPEVLVLIEDELCIKDELNKAVARILNLDSIVNLKPLRS